MVSDLEGLMALIFERVEAQAEFFVYRARIRGGWLVAMKYYDSEHHTEGHTTSESYAETGRSWAWGAGWGYGYGYGGLTFVPDPNHEWDGHSVDSKVAPRPTEKPPNQSSHHNRNDREPRW